MADPINNIVGQEAIDDINKLKIGLSDLVKSFKEVTIEVSSMESQLNSAKSLKNLIASYEKIEILKNKNVLISKQLELQEQKLADATSKAQLSEQKRLDYINSQKTKELELEQKKETIKSKQSKDEITALNTSTQQWKQYFDNLNKGYKDAEKQSKDFSKALQQQITDASKADKATLGGVKEGASVSVYQNARKEIGSLVDRLRSLDLAYQKAVLSGKYTQDQLSQMSKNVKSAREQWQILNDQLVNVEGASGGSTRSYNAMLTETNQLLRELPNFAISARTGILSISNNLPMFMEAWQRTSRAIDETTNKAKGFKGALGELGKALMSWQTIAIVAISLLIQYNKEITELVTGASAMEKATSLLNKNIKESNDGYSKQISSLLQLKSSLSSTTATLEEKRVALRNVQDEFKGYFDDLTIASDLNDKLNSRIQSQIDLLKQKALQEAVSKSAQELTSELLVEEEKLARKLKDTYSGTEEILFDIVEGFAQILPGFKSTYEELLLVENGTIKLSDANHKRLMEQYELFKQGELSKVAYQQIANSILDTDKAQRELNEGMSFFGQILGANDSQMSKMHRTMSDLELSLLGAETNQRKFLKGSREWVSASKDVLKFRQEVELAKLDLEFGGDVLSRTMNKEYRERRRAIIQEDVNETREGSKKREKILWDYVKAIKDVQKELAKIRFDVSIADSETIANEQKAIVDNEKKGYKERLEALSVYNSEKNKQSLFQLQRELDEIDINQRRKEELERQFNVKINTLEDIEKLVRVKNMTNEQKTFLSMSLTYNETREKIEKEHLERLSKSQEDYSKSSFDIYMDDINKLGKNYANGLKESTDKILAINNKWISDLMKQRDEGLISEKAFYSQLSLITRKEGDVVLQNNIEFIKEFKEDIGGMFTSQEFAQLSKEQQDALTLFYSTLENAEADAIRRLKTKKSDDSLFGTLISRIYKSYNLSDADKALIEKTYMDAFSSIINSLNTMWDNYYEKRRQALDEQQKSNEKYAQDEKNRVNSSLLTAEEKEQALKNIDAQRLANEQELDRKRRELARRQAEDEKKQAIFSATLSFTTGIMKIWEKFAYAPIIALPLTIALGTAFAAQLAAINSSAIPAYEDGTPIGGHGGGIALVGEKRRELVITPDGKLFYTPSKPTLMDLPKGSHVLPNPDGMSNMAKNEALDRLTSDNMSVNNGSNDILASKFDNLSNIIRNKQENHIFLQNGELKKFVRKANTRINWVNK